MSIQAKRADGLKHLPGKLASIKNEVTRKFALASL